MAILDHVFDHTRAAPGRPALLTREGTWTYGDLMAATHEIRDALAAGSNERGSIAIVMTGEGEAVAALLATQVAGCSAVLLPSGLAPQDLLHYLAVSEVAAILLPPSVHGLRSVLGMSGAGKEVQRVLQVPLESRQRLSAGSATWIMQLTSGSLGPSRLAARPDAGIEAEVGAVRERLALTASDRVLCTSSLAHSYALVGGLLAGLAVGASVVLPGPPEGLVDTLCRTRPTVVFGIAGTYRHLLANAARLPISVLQGIRLALSAGAPLPDGLFAEVMERFDLPIRQDYGTTETGTIAIDTSDSPRPDQAGTPLPHLEVRLSPFDGAQEKEILIRSPSTARFYLDRHGPTSCLDEEGWYHTGDASWMDNQGRLILGRRLRPRVQIGGDWIDPSEVERRMAEAPGVREVAVLSVPDMAGRPILKAVVVAPQLDTLALRQWCREHLSSAQQPALLELRDALPRSPAGKVLHKEMLGGP